MRSAIIPVLRPPWRAAMGAARRGGNDPLPTWTPSSLDWVPTKWCWYETRDLTTLFADRSMTPATPASVDGPVGTRKDKSPNGFHEVAPSDSARPILRQSGNDYWLEYDGIDDEIILSSAAADMFRAVSVVCLAAAARYTTVGESRYLFAASTGTAANIRAALALTTGGTHGPRFAGRRLDADSAVTLSRASEDANDYVTRALIDYANSNAYLYHNGSLITTNTSFQTDGNTENTASARIGHGALNGASFWKGRDRGGFFGALASFPTGGMAEGDAYLASLTGA